MSDFYQNGHIATLHHIGPVNVEEIESRIVRYSRWRPVSLILPSLYSELEGEALPNIVEELKKVPYLTRIVVGLDRADEKQFHHAREFFSGLPQKTTIVWNEGPRMKDIYSRLKDEGLIDINSGKGRNVWMCMGYLLACRDTHVMALHDCDILTYERLLLARLVYPLVDPNMEYEYAKGYYARVTDRFHGRVTRLFVTPLVRALREIVGPVTYLEYLNAFRYPLAGEFALKASLARVTPVPSNWGLEVGMLGEVYRNCTPRRVCQVDLALDYDHKHQDLSEEDPTKGLHKMSTDISMTLLSTLASQGVSFSEGMFRALKGTYRKLAEDTLRLYEDDASINGFAFDRHAEGKAVEIFTSGLDTAGRAFLEDPLGAPPIASWSRVTAAIPNIFEELLAAVEEDNRN